MSERGKKGEKAGRTKPHKPERKRNARRWFSLDSLMGKALCVLLVVILTVGAFVAPKLINNLYDAGTLMQISYLDMDLSPYAVPYTTFQDKIEAIARARTMGNRLVALPAEETAERLSDEELIEIVNREMETAGLSMDVLFREGWWDAQTVDNLISREKHTVYMRAPAGGEEAVQEMTPFQVWTLAFEVTEKQNELVVYSEKEKKVLSQFATRRLIVCLDADFYKIVAFALQGDREQTNELYGRDMAVVFGAGPDAPEEVQKAAALYSRYAGEERAYISGGIRQAWVSYWDIRLKDFLYQSDREGTLGAYLIFADEAAAAQGTAAGTAETSGVDVAAEPGAEAASGAGNYTDLYDGRVVEVYDADTEIEARERELKVREAEGYPAEVLPVIEGGEMFLETGSRVEWEETDDNIWVLKSGCMEFFEMMQF